MEGPVVLLGGRVAIHSLHEADGEFRRVRPIVPRIPKMRLRGLGGNTLEIGLEVSIGGHRDFEIARKDFEDSGHIRCALNIRVAAQSVYSEYRSEEHTSEL